MKGISMSVNPRKPALIFRAGATSILTAAAIAGSALIPSMSPQAHATGAGTQALQVAASKEGAPYQWGAEGPWRFDCSGLVLYAFKKAGKQLPRTAAGQYNATQQVPRSERRAGDLVFFHSGGHVYHVGIYAGDGRIWHSPRPGKHVRLEHIWTDNVTYGRVN